VEFIGVQIIPLVRFGSSGNTVVVPNSHGVWIQMYTTEMPNWWKNTRENPFSMPAGTYRLNRTVVSQDYESAYAYALKYMQHYHHIRPWAYIGIVPVSNYRNFVTRETACVPAYEVVRKPWPNAQKQILYRVRINQLEVPK